MSIEAMKQALEALDLAKRSHGKMLLSDPPQEAWKTYRVDDAIRESTTALRQAIEQAKKREWVGLTEEEVDEIYSRTMAYDAVRVAEEMLRKKNT